MSARLERERCPGKISKKVTFWIDDFSWKYRNSTSILVLSLESRANPRETPFQIVCANNPSAAQGPHLAAQGPHLVTQGLHLAAAARI